MSNQFLSELTEPPRIETPPAPTGLARLALLIGDYVRNGVVILFWTVIACAAAAAAIISCAVIVWALKISMKAVGGH